MKIFIPYFLILFLLTNCSVNLLPKSVKNSDNQKYLEEKGKAILEKAWLAQGLNQLENKSTYVFTYTNSWKGLFSGIGKIWPQKVTRITQRSVPNTFDSQIEFLDGKTKGLIFGLQSWHYYEIKNDKVDFNVKQNQKYIFGLTAFQYFIELASRMKNAEIIRYAGEKEWNGKSFNLVYVTWKSIKKSKNHDQYLLYINKENNLLEYASYTVRNNYLKLPGASSFYGSAHFTNFKSIEGVKIPHDIFIFLNKPKSKDSKYLETISIEEFNFNSFNKEILYPNKTLQPIGDKKP